VTGKVRLPGRSGTAEPVLLDVHPRKLRVICLVSGIAVVLLFAVLSTALHGKTEGGGVFERGDQLAMIALGVLFALGILAFARPRVRADARGVRIRNVVGGYELPWEVVKAVRFSRHSPWASLELADDDEVTMMAIQAADKEYALDAVRGLRRLLAEHGGAAGTAGGRVEG
jgi:hypothetical protein